MDRKSFVLPVAGLLIIGSVALTKCEGAKPGDSTADSTNVHLNSPAPDNNSATNPSMADTAFHKDTGRKKTDPPRP